FLVFNACRGTRAVGDSVGPSVPHATERGQSGMARIPSWLALDDGQWLQPAKDYASTRFSSLDQIDVRNAANLRLAFTFSAGLSKGHEAAPFVVDGKVLVGNSGAEFGVRGKLTALDLADGKVAWTAWSTGPDRDVLLGSRFHPFYPSDRGQDLGVTSWPPEGWKIGGGTVS